MSQIELPRCLEAATKLLSFVGQSSGTTAAAPSTSALSLFAAPTAATATPIDLEVAFVLAPVPHRVPLFFTLPHEVNDGSICVVTKPPQRKYKDLITKAQEEGNPVAMRVKKVIDSSKLEKKFQDPVAMRALAKSFDHFVTYKLSRYPKLLTGEFLHHQSLPVWASNDQFVPALEGATRTAVVPRRGFDSVTVRVGHVGLTAAQIAENVESLVGQLLASADGCTVDAVLQIRLAGKNAAGKRAALPLYSHDFSKSHPGVMRDETDDDAAKSSQEPDKKRRRTK